MERRTLLKLAFFSGILPSIGVTSACGDSARVASNSGGGYMPTGPVRIAVPAGPGGGLDVIARTVVQLLETEKLDDVPMPVENYSGNSGSVFANERFLQSAEFEGRDNILLTVSTSSLFSQFEEGSPARITDGTLIASLSAEYEAIVVPADSRFQDLTQLVEAIKSDPKAVPVGGGSVDKGVFDMLLDDAGADASQTNFVLYETGAEQVVGLANGDLQAGVAGTVEFVEHVEAKTLRALAVIAPERLKGAYADTPTAKDAGYDVTFANWRAFIGPPEMPQEAADYWADKFEQLVATEVWKTQEENFNWVPYFRRGDDFVKLTEQSYASIKKSLRASGVL